MKEKQSAGNFKKIAGLVFILLSLGSALYGGGQKTSPTTSQSKYTGDLPFVTLKYYDIGDRAPALDAVLAKMNEVMRDELNCELAVEYIPWDGFEQKYQLVFASGEEFDSIYAASWSAYGAVATKNGFLELTPDFIRKNAPFVADQIPESGWNQVKVNGKIYMIPHTTREFNHYVIAVRGDLREQYGLPPIETYDDLERYLTAVKKNNPELVPISMGLPGNISNWMVLWNLMHDRFQVGELFIQLFYVDINTPNAKIVNFLEQPDAREFMTMMNRWQKAGFWTRSALSSTQMSQDDFNNGLAAACIGNAGTLEGVYVRDRDNNNSTWKVELYDLTAKANKKVPTYPYNAGGIALNRNAKNPDRVLMMVDLFRRDRDLNNLAQRGLRGIHWDYEADGKTLKAKMPPVPPEQAYGGAITWGPFRNVEFMISYSSESSVNFRTIIDNSITRELTVPATAFLFNDSNVKNETAAVSDVFQQYVLPMFFGFTDPSELPNVVQRLKAAGIDTIIADMQKQMDANK